MYQDTGNGLEVFTAIQGVCAWPNLQKLPDGTLIATIFNQPCHGEWEGDVDCWASEDSGVSWAFRGRPAPHAPSTNRMNCAAGIAGNGDMVVICSGWDVSLPPSDPNFRQHSNILQPLVSRSSDGARNWDVVDVFPEGPGGMTYIPFGDVTIGDDGKLRVTVRARTRTENPGAFMLSSDDDGLTWGDPVLMTETGSETQAIHLGNGRWLAASREEQSVGVVLLGSDDDGRTWETRMPLTLPMQHNGHLLELADGRVALTYGNRNWNNYGVDTRVSDDQGKTWGPPMRIGSSDFRDCGYPYTAQRDDGRLATAWYAKTSNGYHYEMRISVWDPDIASRDSFRQYSGPKGFGKVVGTKDSVDADQRPHPR